MAGTRSRHGVAPLLSLSPMLTLLICPSVDAVVYQGSGNRCSAWYRGHCPNPNDLSVIGLHVSVGTLKDCMTYCYQAFVYGGPPCAFGVFLGTLQSDNCLIINAGGQTTMEDYLDQCSNKGQPTSKASQWSEETPACPEAIDTSPCFQSAAGEVYEGAPQTTKGMRFAVTDCSGQTPSHEIDSSAAGFDGAACFDEAKAYNEDSDVTDPYMIWHGGKSANNECRAVKDASMEITCLSIVFKGPFANAKFEDGSDYSEQKDYEYFTSCTAYSDGGQDGGTTSPPPSPSLAPSPPIPPQAPALPSDAVEKNVKVTFMVDEACTDAFKLKVKTATATACKVAISNTEVSCTPTSSTRRRRLDTTEVTVTMGTTEADANAVQTVAEAFFRSGDASIAFGTTVSGATFDVTDAISSDPHPPPAPPFCDDDNEAAVVFKADGECLGSVTFGQSQRLEWRTTFCDIDSPYTGYAILRPIPDRLEVFNLQADYTNVLDGWPYNTVSWHVRTAGTSITDDVNDDSNILRLYGAGPSNEITKDSLIAYSAPETVEGSFYIYSALSDQHCLTKFNEGGSYYIY